ncbi:hypothetical protein ANN_11068 [Periplaneta americana]|uniref:Uncharacterized protein n=1 Tax=Periplaneta americana TaxID=6978 RepID=A0ABQ8T5Q7_PERAM|nr:hypothetical protein ANN_11068 [Periplaneta americana]
MSRCACMYKCKNLSYEHKVGLFEDFYDLEDIEKRESYLMGLMQVSHVKRRRHGTYDDPSQSRRQTTIHYTVLDGQRDLVQVSRGTFSEIFALTQKKVQSRKRLQTFTGTNNMSMGIKQWIGVLSVLGLAECQQQNEVKQEF